MTPDLTMIYHVKETLSTSFLCFWFPDVRERKYLCNILQVCVCEGGKGGREGVQRSGTEVQVCNSFYIALRHGIFRDKG